MSLESFERLSTREQHVLVSLMKGATAREIANRDCVSLATVRSQIHAIISKLGVSSQLTAVVLAYRSGWPEGRESWQRERPAV
ncbi:MAG: helix-turn-helix transcriptional regulator [Acidimicrobiales bacterium]